MIHQRKDYMRIQEPTELLESLRLVTKIAEIAIEDYTSPEKTEAVEKAKALLSKYDSLLSSTPIGENEPVFLLRAKDSLAPGAVEDYARKHVGPLRDVITEWAHFMREWQRKNGSKWPDQPDQIGDGSVYHSYFEPEEIKTPIKSYQHEIPFVDLNKGITCDEDDGA